MSETPSDSKSVRRKVFVSYAHTSEPHIEWILAFVADLQANGIEVVVDQYDLKEGQDANTFMEKVVTDKTIDRVLIVSDENYAAKADGRKGGVGTESQIITQKLYKDIEETRFIPILKERDDQGNACLPVFLGGRIYIDFSNPDAYATRLEELTRVVFDKPKRIKPPLGKPPAYITDDTVVSLKCVRSARTFREVLTSGKGNPPLAFDQFKQAVLEDLEEFQLEFKRGNEEEWPDRVLLAIEQMKPIRDRVVEVLECAFVGVEDEWLSRALVEFLEKIAELTRLDEQTEGPRFPISTDNYRFFALEIFLYVLAVAIKRRRYQIANHLLTVGYSVSERRGGDDVRHENFGVFHDPPDSLEVMANQKLNPGWIRYSGHLMAERATNSAIRLIDLVQADAIALLAAVKQHARWGPTVSINGKRSRQLPLFDELLRTAEPGAVGVILGLSTFDEITEVVLSDQMKHFYNSSTYWRSTWGDGDLVSAEEIARIRDR
ncbi:SEFIR domain-containing protein [Rhodopirellula baltica]|uniref:SEFIR domain-containing protein n=1 Tax=Rhodopirellula baltica (strain DSM 10527 / NCIMB 13988 / SH1) TaxID=243090 RepID=Q7UT52_RHOBA|nr:SEFIR domain-containing protein [Rhodopirellula baltica]CAD73587.1 hypothetical protein-transmembrane prediction [Rhodopirellula baltica SH 1]